IQPGHAGLESLVAAPLRILCVYAKPKRLEPELYYKLNNFYDGAPPLLRKETRRIYIKHPEDVLEIFTEDLTALRLDNNKVKYFVHVILRSTNICESFHRNLNSLSSNDHPDIYQDAEKDFFCLVKRISALSLGTVTSTVHDSNLYASSSTPTPFHHIN
ncbi:hypothetical protein L9F63_010752, partial [Diploptera punctata]